MRRHDGTQTTSMIRNHTLLLLISHWGGAKGAPRTRNFMAMPPFECTTSKKLTSQKGLLRRLLPALLALSDGCGPAPPYQ